MAKSADTSQLAGLHKKFADYLESLVDEATATDEDGNPIGLPLDAATLGNIRGFLKDNDITADPVERDNLAELRRKYSRAASGASPEVKKALAEAQDDLAQGGMLQ